MKALSSYPADRDLRKTGIGPLKLASWGTHLCQFYKTKKDLLSVVVPYFKMGLENNEMCVWVTSESVNTKEAIEAMRKAVPSFSKFQKKGQIEIFPYTEWYLKGGYFEMRRVLNDWIKKYKLALSKGFAGLRVSGNPFWIDNKKDWKAFTDYEAEIDKVISNYKLLVLCTYSLEKCKSTEIIDVISNHEYAIIKRSNQWRTIETTAYKKLKESFHISESVFRAVAETAHDAIISADSRGDIIYFNKGAEEMFGYSALEIKNKPLPILMPERFRQFHRRGFSSFLSNGKSKVIGKTIELAGLKKNGNEFPIELSLAHWQVDKKNFFTSIIRDITDRKIIEERKDDFISIAAHELKSPVATIKVMNEILLEILDDNQRAKKYLTGTKHEVARLTKLVNDLLNVSRIQAGNLELYKSKFSLQRLIKEVADNVQVTTKKHKIFTKGKINRKVFADREWIRQVLINLLSNAIKFSPKKGKIVIDLKDNSDKIVVSVTDYGIGIQKDHQDKIFNRFYRIHNHNTNKAYPGLGIGLYLSQQITKLHQGEIWVKSTKGQGSTFYFSLPYK